MPSRTPKRCGQPLPTKRLINPDTAPRAWCSGCKTWQPAEQVSWDRMRLNAAGTITATFAPIAH